MCRDGKHKGIILAVKEVKLLSPQPLDYMGVNEAAGGWHLRLHRRPIVEMPIGGDLDNATSGELCHLHHPFCSVGNVIGLDGTLRTVRYVVQLGIVMHEE